MAEKDPLSQIYDALWSLLEADDAWAAMVPDHARIKFSGDNEAPRLDEGLTADRPMVKIQARNVSPYLTADSSNSKVTAVFEVLLLSGDQRFDASLFPLIWETFRALHDYPTVLGVLTWNGSRPYVKRLQSQDCGIGIRQIEEDNRTRWWTAIWSLQLELWFPASLLKPPTD